MKLGTIKTSSGQEELVFGLEQGAITVSKAVYKKQNQGPLPDTMSKLLENPDRYIDELKNLYGWVQEQSWEESDLIKESELSPPVTNPGKILCIGLNYRPHAKESNMEIPTYPLLFSKFNNSLVGNDQSVVIPKEVEQLDYEAELVIVMGKTCKNVTQEQSLDYVFGYTNGNDLSARDLQLRTSQWLLGKTLNGFAPVGPYVIVDDLDPDNLDIKCLLNGEKVQHDNTSNMIFSCRYIISYLSQYLTLLPGDIIFTGTPDGVILGKPQQQRQWLKSGDVLEVEIEGLGSLTTHLSS